MSGSANGQDDRQALLRIDGLTIGTAHAPIVEDVSLVLARGETLAVVGESGSGKSLTALALMGLLPAPLAVRQGRIALDGEDVGRLSRRQRRALCGSRIGMVFQEPMTALNPVYPIGRQIVEAIRAHARVGRRQARARTLALLEAVGMPDPAARFGDYPHRLSGGMRQRVMIAMALASGPSLLIADEPTTALDVTVQAQVLALLGRLRQERGMAMMLITHDLGVAAAVADKVAVMYAGRIVEVADVNSLFDWPRHPYTIGLLAAMPRLDARTARLAAIGGAVPRPDAYPAGCRFHPRCPFAVARCREEAPPLVGTPAGAVACWQAPLEAAC